MTIIVLLIIKRYVDKERYMRPVRRDRSVALGRSISSLLLARLSLKLLPPAVIFPLLLPSEDNDATTKTMRIRMS